MEDLDIRLWMNMGRLAADTEWRLTRQPISGLPSDLECASTRVTCLFGRERHFSSGDRIEAFLRLIEAELELEPDSWHDQKSFFTDFAKSFFRDDDGPAWLKISPIRRSFHQRVRVGPSRKGPSILFGPKILQVKDVKRGDVRLNGIRVPTRSLNLVNAHGDGQASDWLQSVFVYRTLPRGKLGTTKTAMEEWCFVMTGDPEEQAAVRRGLNPVVEQFRDIQGLQRAPLISLCRLRDNGQTVINRCVSLHPRTGQVIDLRPSEHSAEYYFRSDLTNHLMLVQSLSRGHSDRL